MATPLDQQNDVTSSSSSAEDEEYEPSSKAEGEKIKTDEQNNNKLPPLLQGIVDKVGKIDESRIVSTPEYLSGDVPKLFSNLHYETSYQTNTHGNETESIVTITSSATHSNTNFISSSALLCGTALGSGLLTLPAAISTAGYLPTIVATLVAWAYMTISALLTSELLLNRFGETGRVRNVGLLELYSSYLGEVGGKVAGIGFLIVSYVVMGVYLSEGGDHLMRILEVNDFTLGSGGVVSASLMAVGDSGGEILSSSASSSMMGDLSTSIFNNPTVLARALFALIMGTFLSTASKFNTVQKAMTHVFFPLTLIAFIAAITIGLPTADFGALTALENQHPEVVLNAFPLMFMGWTYHGVVPRVVYDLEGDKKEITKAIVVGSTLALVMYLTWNAMILGNVLGSSSSDVIDGGVSSIESMMASVSTDTAAAASSSLMGTIQASSAVVLSDMLGMDGDGVQAAIAAATATTSPPSLDTLHFDTPLLQSSIAIVSELAVITSLIGVVLGFVNEFNDALGTLPSTSYGPKEDNKWKVALLTLLPPAIASMALGYYSGYYDINNYEIIDYTGIFGSSVLFLILPALMAWTSRYAVEDSPRPLTVRPMVPLGKIALGSLYKAAGTLIVEQGLEKLGVFEFVKGLTNSGG